MLKTSSKNVTAQVRLARHVYSRRHVRTCKLHAQKRMIAVPETRCQLSHQFVLNKWLGFLEQWGYAHGVTLEPDAIKQ